jgi:hypothetical protein
MLRQQTDLNSTALLDRWKVSRFCNNPEKSSYGTRGASRKNPPLARLLPVVD